MGSLWQKSGKISSFPAIFPNPNWHGSKITEVWSVPSERSSAVNRILQEIDLGPSDLFLTPAPCISRYLFLGRTSEEVDSYLLGELNLCLRPQDSVLSGPSVTKALNTASNQMVKNLLILNGPGERDIVMAGSILIVGNEVRRQPWSPYLDH